MLCKECGFLWEDLYKNVDKIEKLQEEIDELYDHKSIPKDKIRSLEKLRDILVDEIWQKTSRYEWLREKLLKYGGLPIKWRTGDRIEHITYARASDDEADEMQDDEEAGENEDDVLKYIEYAEIIMMGMAVVLSLLKWC